MSLNLASILRQAAKDHTDKTAIVLGKSKLSFSTVDAFARGFAGALTGLGLEPGDKVALMLPNVPHFTIAYYGAHYGGHPVVPLNVLLTADEVAYHLQDSEAKALIAWEGFAPAAAAGFERAAACDHLVIARADMADTTAPTGAHNFTALIGGASAVTELAPTMPDDTAVILYTSGTTGKPKGAELTHFNMYYNAECSARSLGGMTEKDVYLCTLPLFHSFGQTVMQNGAFHVGATVVLQPRFEPLETMGLIQDNRVTVFAGVPTMYFALLNHPEAHVYDLSSLTDCMSGGSAMPVEVMRAFDAKYNVNVLEGYGLSETSPVASSNLKDRPKKVGSIGLPIAGVEFKLIDDAGETVTGLNTPGEICIKGHNVMKGYYNRPDATKEAIDALGWFRTGDIGTVDEDGYYFIVDRKKDMVIRGGFNVYPREVEETLYAHPAIAEAAVIGVPHESHGEEVKAIVALKPGQQTTPEEIMGYCRQHLAAYKYPRIIEILDTLPKGPTGKILKRELRD